MMKTRSIPPLLLALSGDQLTAPADTASAYWAALGGGADGLALTVRLTADNIPVCLAKRTLSATTNDPRNIDQVTVSELRQMDAGAQFRSRELDENNRLTGEVGDDLPWVGGDRKRRVTHTTLWDTLCLFGRRCTMLLLIPEEITTDQLGVIVGVVRNAGLTRRVTIAANRKQLDTLPKPLARALITDNPDAAINAAKTVGAKSLVVPFASAFEYINETPKLEPKLMAALKTAHLDLMLMLDADEQPAPPPNYNASLWDSSTITGLLSPAPLSTVEVVTLPALMVYDDFAGTKINRGIWSAGYSHANQDTEIHQEDGMHIVIQAGGDYSGGAAVCKLPIHRRFDAQVEFHVENPYQGTTFEMAAIGIDPGYYHIDNSDLGSRSVNLTFDVHGAPPYASSERDENDGFRCGWNNGFNLTRIDSAWAADSVNMYNKYGRDVGDGSPESKRGELRLIRNGAVFASYYRDRHNRAWINSGAMLVQNLNDDVFIRLAAKHWKKQNPAPPGNHIIFYHFRLYQY
jgi:hypothetical protein